MDTLEKMQLEILDKYQDELKELAIENKEKFGVVVMEAYLPRIGARHFKLGGISFLETSDISENTFPLIKGDTLEAPTYFKIDEITNSYFRIVYKWKGEVIQTRQFRDLLYSDLRTNN